MVLQSDTALPIWGWADPGEEITVTLSHETATTKADASGRWQVKLGKLKTTHGPQTLTVKGRNTVTVQDVLIGEVWLASGQSNMEMQIKGRQHGAVDRADEEIAAADHPGIRMFVRRDPFDIYKLKSPAEKPQEDVEGQWQVCSPETVAAFSAVGYFFARELEHELAAPMGIIASAVGGTPIEAWTSMDAQIAVAPLKPMLDDWSQQLANYHGQQDYDAFMQAKSAWLKQRALATKSGQPIPKAPKPFKNLQVMKPVGLFNAEIAPLIPYALRGVIWYQGERNAAGPFTGLYGEQLGTLIHDWRTRWGDDFYFAWVQLPRFKAVQKIPSAPNDWGVSVRDEMRKTLRVPNTGMAITIDMGGVTVGHPTNKIDYAHRLALLALHDVYHKMSDECSGPLFRSVKREEGKMIISFDHAEGLKIASGEELKGFAIAGQDQKFLWAKAEIHGDKVMVSNEKVPEPIAVRYGWASNPPCNLVNAANLPASPFRTDDWK
jgi:sialate O-acetylesterase